MGGVLFVAKRRRRRIRTRRKRPGAILIVLLLVLVAGFLTRRLLVPRAVRFLTHRSPEGPLHSSAADHRAPDVNGPGENLSDSDRRTLDSIVRQRAGGR